jgi:hypothetical protein
MMFRGLTLVPVLILITSSMVAHARDARMPAQDAGSSRFQPPRPPALDNDAFDDDDELDLGDDVGGGYRPPPPPAPPGGAAGAAPGSPGDSGRPTQPPLYTQSTFTSAKKFQFKIVEGEYWEKGKKRQRGAEIHVTDGGAAATSSSK